MNISTKNAAIGAGLLILASVALTRYYWPRTVVQVQTETKEVVKNDVRTVIREVVKKDGTKETVTEILDKSQKQLEQKKTAALEQKPDWYVGAGVRAEQGRLSKQSYELLVSRRFLGPVFLGGSVTTNKSVGLHVGFEF